MKHAFRIALACGLSIASLAACGKKQDKPFVTPSKPLPGQIDISIKRHSFDTNGVLRPYEAGLLIIAGPGIQNHPSDERIWVDADSRMDGQPLPESMIRRLQFGGASTLEKDQRCLTLGPAFQPWSLLPRKTGSTTFDLVLHTGREKWICPPLVVEIGASADEARMLSEFDASGASPFLDHPLGARRASEPEAPAPPYAAVADFAAQHPDSYLTAAIRDRLNRLYLEDINSCGPYADGPLLAEDRAALASLAGSCDPHFAKRARDILAGQKKSMGSSDATEPQRQRLSVMEDWLHLATTAPEKETPK